MCVSLTSPHLPKFHLGQGSVLQEMCSGGRRSQSHADKEGPEAFPAEDPVSSPHATRRLLTPPPHVAEH